MVQAYYRGRGLCCAIITRYKTHSTMTTAYALRRTADENGALSFAAITAALQAHGFTLEEWLRDAQLRCLRQDGCDELLHWLGY